MIPLAVVAVVSGLAAVGVGVALSYGALRGAAVGWGFGGWQSYAFPIGVDGLIIALYTVDLVMAWRRMARPWMRIAAHAITGVTIVLNMSAAAGSAAGSPGLATALGEHPARLLSHAAMPIAYALLIEAARGAVVRVARLESGVLQDGSLTLADWVLRTGVTWKIFKHAKTYPTTIAEARIHVRELAVYRIWLKHREEIEAGLTEGQVGVLDRMPQRLAPYAGRPRKHGRSCSRRGPRRKPQTSAAPPPKPPRPPPQPNWRPPKPRSRPPKPGPGSRTPKHSPT